MRTSDIRFKAASLVMGLTAIGAGILSACSSDPDVVEYGDEPDTGVGEDSGSDVMDAQPDRARRDASDAGNDAKADADAMSDADARLDADAKGKDADADAVVYAETGAPCSPIGLTQAQYCGFCGSRERVCADLEDSGAATWAEWGACLHSVENGCTPGETIDASCGRCGSASIKCQNNCKLPAVAAGSCKNQGVCTPGESEYHYGVSCDAGGRAQTCDETCQWGDLSECMFEDMPELLVPEAVGGKNTIQITFSAAMPTHQRLNTGACPTSISGTVVTYQYVRIRNTTGHDARVSVWDAVPDGGASNDTIMAVYDTGAMPKDSDPTARSACMAGTSVWDTCSGTLDPTMCKGQQSGFTDVGGVLPGNTLVAPANSILIIYDAPWSTSGYRTYDVNIMTHSFSP